MLRRALQRPPRRRATEFVWPAPTGGLVKSGSLVGSDPRTSEVLTNFIPTSEGARLRGGAAKFATITGAVTQLFTYRSGSQEKLFAASASQVTDISSVADVSVAEVPDIRGLASGNWSSTQFGTPGGQFLTVVNGSDYLHYYNGTEWNPVAGVAVSDLDYDGLTANFTAGETLTGGTSGATAEILSINPATATTGTLRLGTITGGPFQDNEAITSATGAAVANGASTAGSAITITGVSTKVLSHVWSHKNRQWFVEKNTLSAWYLPVDSIGGAASEFPLDGVFKFGGSLLFGGTWSVDAGDGLDDVQVFITTEGEIAAYQGNDPSTASEWAIVGVYRIGKPLDKNAWFNSGGDLVVLTEDGVVPISEALRKDRAALQAAAITAPIEDLWQNLVALRTSSFNFSVTLWPTRTYALFGVPSGAGEVSGLVANTRTGAWSQITGWDIQCSTIHADGLYFGTSDGIIARADTTGLDIDSPFTGYWVPKFQEMQSADEKIALHARILWRSTGTADPQVAVFQNYTIGEYPVAVPIDTSTATVWGTATWGTSVWGGTSTAIFGDSWQGVNGQGFSLAPAVVISSNSAATPSFEIVSAILRFEVGRSI